MNPDTIRVTGAGGAEQVVLTTGGIRALADVLATMREPQLRGEESSELELPVHGARGAHWPPSRCARRRVHRRRDRRLPRHRSAAVRGAEPAGADRRRCSSRGRQCRCPTIVPQPRPQACAAVWLPIPPTAARSRICARRWPERALALSGHVGIPGDEPAADFGAGEAVGTGATQDAQHVVLRLGELVRLEHDRHLAREQVGGADQIEVGLFLAAGKRPPLLRIATEACPLATDVSRLNRYCQ